MNEQEIDRLRSANLDAIAWIEAHINMDAEGKVAVGRNTNPLELLEALTAQFLALVKATTGNRSQEYLDFIRGDLDRLLAEVAAEHPDTDTNPTKETNA